MSLPSWQSIGIALLLFTVNAGSTPLDSNGSKESAHPESIPVFNSCQSCQVVHDINCTSSKAAWLKMQVQSDFPDDFIQQYDGRISSDAPVETIALTDRLLVIQAQSEPGSDSAQVMVMNFQARDDPEEHSTQVTEIQIRGKLYRVYRDMLYSFSAVDDAVYIYPYPDSARLYQAVSPLTVDLDTLAETSVVLLSVVSDGKNIWLTTEDRDTGKIRAYWQKPVGIIQEIEIQNAAGQKLSQAQLVLHNQKPVLVPVSTSTIDILNFPDDANESNTPFELACLAEIDSTKTMKIPAHFRRDAGSDGSCFIAKVFEKYCINPEWGSCSNGNSSPSQCTLVATGETCLLQTQHNVGNAGCWTGSCGRIVCKNCTATWGIDRGDGDILPKMYPAGCLSGSAPTISPIPTEPTITPEPIGPTSNGHDDHIGVTIGVSVATAVVTTAIIASVAMICYCIFRQKGRFVNIIVSHNYETLNSAPSAPPPYP